MVHETIQGTFRQTNLTNESADYLAKRIILIDDVGAASSAIPGSPPITQIAFPACRAHYPGGPDRCLSVSSLSARPSPVNGRVGIHNFTYRRVADRMKSPQGRILSDVRTGDMEDGRSGIMSLG